MSVTPALRALAPRKSLRCVCSSLGGAALVLTD